MKLRCLIVDDEPLARMGIANHISKTENSSLVKFARNATEAKGILDTCEIDLIFLDIHMPGITGVEFMRTNKSLPPVIIVTANPDFALTGYDLNVVDYLVKPVEFERFQKAFLKASDANLLARYQKDNSKHILIKADGQLQKIVFTEILYFESMLNYVKVVTGQKTWITHASLKGFEEELPADLFVKIHKSYVVSLSKVTALKSNQVFLGKVSLPVSRNLKSSVREKLVQRVENVKFQRF